MISAGKTFKASLRQGPPTDIVGQAHFKPQSTLTNANLFKPLPDLLCPIFLQSPG